MDYVPNFRISRFSISPHSRVMAIFGCIHPIPCLTNQSPPRHEFLFILPNFDSKRSLFSVYIILCSRKNVDQKGRESNNLSRLSALPLSNCRTGIAEFNLLALHLKL